MDFRGLHSGKGETMSNMKSSIKEAAGSTEEELGEAMGNDKMAHKGRQLRNEGRIGNGKAPKLNKVGSEK
jgi:uncharacterized protein YjbJ (UPF0337 family)